MLLTISSPPVNESVHLVKTAGFVVDQFMRPEINHSIEINHFVHAGITVPLLWCTHVHVVREDGHSSFFGVEPDQSWMA